MPIYEYSCKKCGHSFEIMNLSRDAFTDVKCPECQATDVNKQSSTFSASVASGSPSSGAGNLPCGGCPSSGGCGFN